jgi:hypothetical protein
MTRPDFEPGPLRWEARDEPLELWSGHLREVSQSASESVPTKNHTYFYEDDIGFELWALQFRVTIWPPDANKICSEIRDET